MVTWYGHLVRTPGMALVDTKAGHTRACSTFTLKSGDVTIDIWHHRLMI